MANFRKLEYLLFASRVFEKINGGYLPLNVLLWALETVL